MEEHDALPRAIMTSDKIWDLHQFDLDSNTKSDDIPILAHHRPADYNICGEYIGIAHDIIGEEIIPLKTLYQES